MKNWVKILQKLSELGWTVPKLAKEIGDTEFNTRFAIQEESESQNRLKIEMVVGWSFEERLDGKLSSVTTEDEIQVIKTEIHWRKKTIECFGGLDPKERSIAESEIEILKSILLKLRMENYLEKAGQEESELPAKVRRNVEISKQTIAGIAAS